MKPNLPSRIVSVDCESLSLFGCVYAIGWSVVDDGREIKSGCVWCLPELLSSPGNLDVSRSLDLDWARMNVLPTLANGDRVSSPKAVYDRFWSDWAAQMARGYCMLVDYGVHPEAQMLIDCVDPEHRDSRSRAFWPIPLLLLSSIEMCAGLDPFRDYPRRTSEGELPDHNPLADARYNARRYFEAKRLLEGKPRERAC